MAKTQGQKRRREAEADLEQKTAAAVATKDGAPPSKKSRVEERRSLFVRSLPASATSESLTEFFSQHYPVKHATVVVDKNTKASRGYGFVTFTDADDAVEAKKKLNNATFGGRKLRLDVAEPRLRAGTSGAVKTNMAEEKKRREEEMAEARKAPKLIIRNLPWSIKKEDQLSKLFMKYGKIKFTDLPQDKGLLKGFGFITFKSRKHAERALAEMNGKDLDGRTIAVDWAVSQDEWKQQQDVVEEKEEKKPKAKKPEKESDKKDGKEMSEADRDLANFMKTMETLDSEDDDDKGDSEDDASEDDEEGGGELSSDDKEDGDSEDEDVDMEDAPAKVEEKPQRTSDNSTTVFIRNLPFTSTDETLKEHFTQFGAVRYARVVMNKAIDKPAGTAFVCFYNADDFKACVKNAPRHQPVVKTAKHSVLQDETIDTDGRYTIDGRVLQVTSAVSKEEATKLTELGPAARKTQDKDKRRLYLLSEGTIPKNSPLYNLLTPTEIKLRDQSAQQRKKQVMTNPSLHLSTIRLAIRNLPRNIDSKELKQLARQAIVGFATDVREGRREELSKEEQTRGGEEDRAAEAKRKDKGVGVVKQAKVVYETTDGKKVKEETGAGKSRGYGFIEYWSHRWALMGLRWLNGHPLKNEAGKTVRLIVEFAIENQQVVSRRKANEVRSRQIQAEIAAGTRKPGEKDEKKDAKGKKGGKKGKAEVEKTVEEEVVSEDEAAKSKKKDATEKLAQRQRIIGRKRMARKSKVGGRKGK